MLGAEATQRASRPCRAVAKQPRRTPPPPPPPPPLPAPQGPGHPGAAGGRGQAGGAGGATEKRGAYRRKLPRPNVLRADHPCGLCCCWCSTKRRVEAAAIRPAKGRGPRTHPAGGTAASAGRPRRIAPGSGAWQSLLRRRLIISHQFQQVKAGPGQQYMEALDKKMALEVIEETNDAWKKLREGKTDKGKLWIGN